MIEEVKLIDKYEDEKKFGKDKVSYAYRIVYRALNKTLTGAEADAMQRAKQLRDEIRIENASREGAPEITFETSKGSTYVQHADGTTTRNKSYHPEHGAADVGIKPKSSATFYVRPEDINRLDIVQARGKKFKDTIADVGQNHIGVVLTA